MFPEQTPYQYAFNSPLIWKDPSGLKGEKERGDKMLAIEIITLHEGCFIVEYIFDIIDDDKSNPLIPYTKSKLISRRIIGFDFIGGGGSNGSGGFKVANQSSGGGFSSLGSGAVYHGGINLSIKNHILSLKSDHMNSEKISKLTHDLNNTLKDISKTTNRETGYFLVKDKLGQLWAKNIRIGEDNNCWFNFKDLNSFQLKDGETLIGFIHIHLGDATPNHGPHDLQFSAGDFRAFFSILKSEFGWMGKISSYNFFLMGVINDNCQQYISTIDYMRSINGLYNVLFIRPKNRFGEIPLGSQDIILWGVKYWDKYGLFYFSIWR